MTLDASLAARLDDAVRATPQWRPWLVRVEKALREDAARGWDRVAVDRRAQVAGRDVAFLDGAVVRIPRDLLGESASESAQFLERAVAQDDEADAELAAIPLLCACRRAHDSVSRASWPHGHCPVCGAWPALAESRGLERARRLRCGRCAADWPFDWLRCPFCGERDHERLASLVPEPDAGRRVDACRSCGGYVKTVATLGALAPGEIAFEDLATVALDVVAIERGFARPRTSPHSARIRVEVVG